MTNKILIIQLRPGLGDLCMFLPRCHEIAQANKNCEIVLLTKQNTKANQVLKYDPFIKRIEYIDENKIKKSLIYLYKFFKINRFFKVYSYQYGPKYLKYIFFSKITGVKEIFYYGIFKRKEDMMKKAIMSNEKWLNIRINKRIGKLYLPLEDKYSEETVVIGIGASGNNKRWPTKNFIELIQRLNKNKFKKFLLAGGKGESHISQEIISNSNNVNIVNLEDFDVPKIMQLINRSSIYVGNDTGFMHISACLGLKTFCLYGDTPSNDSIYNENIIPILPHGKKSVYHDDLLMDKILIQDVFNKIMINYKIL